jgi:hypothetical protein
LALQSLWLAALFDRVVCEYQVNSLARCALFGCLFARRDLLTAMHD